MVGMELLTTLADNWFTALQSVGIIGSLLLAAASLRDDVKERRVETFLTIASEHRKIWSEYFKDPALARIRDESVDLENRPVTLAERRFVLSVILHLNASFQAQRLGSYPAPEREREDIGQFFSRPIPAAVFREQRELLDKAFVDYVERARTESERV